MGVLLLADGRFERYRFLCNLHNLMHTRYTQPHLLCNLLRFGIASKFLQKLAGNAHEFIDGLYHMDRDADGPRLVGNGTRNGLADPPRRVGAELIPLVVVKFLDGL